MSDNSDLKSSALSQKHDFYELLNIQPSAQESEIRKAYRKTALKYHPDHAGADTAKLEKFHLLQIAYEVLLDPAVREIYDNARRAQEEKKQRDAAFEGRRRGLKEDLERRESGAFKRKRDENEAEEEFERELRRIAEDGKRRRKEREEQLREDILRQEREREAETVAQGPSAGVETASAGPSIIDRSVALRFPKNAATAHLDDDALKQLWNTFGPIEDVRFRATRSKPPGGKHKIDYMTGVIVYKSIVGAHAAVSDHTKHVQSDPETWKVFEGVDWAGGKEPECIPKPAATATAPAPVNPDGVERLKEAAIAAPSTPIKNGSDGLKRVPSFASFKSTPARTPGGAGVGSPSSYELTMMRLKNAERIKAERAKLEESIRTEEAAAAREE